MDEQSNQEEIASSARNASDIDAGGKEPSISLPPEKTVSPTDPDFIIFLIFALIIDGIDIALEALGLVFDFVGGIGEILQPISWAIDGIAFVILGWWMYSKGKSIGENRKQRQQALQEKAAAQKGRLEAKAAQAGAKSPARRVMLRLGICFLGEIIPILIGILPFWTISVIMMLDIKKEILFPLIGTIIIAIALVLIGIPSFLAPTPASGANFCVPSNWWSLFQEAGRAENVPPALIAATYLTEHHFTEFPKENINPNSDDPNCETSYAGAIGPFQIMPSWLPVLEEESEKWGLGKTIDKDRPEDLCNYQLATYSAAYIIKTKMNMEKTSSCPWEKVDKGYDETLTEAEAHSVGCKYCGCDTCKGCGGAEFNYGDFFAKRYLDMVACAMSNFPVQGYTGDPTLSGHQIPPSCFQRPENQPGCTGGRAFGRVREGNRRHAGVDLLARDGTPVIAITDGTVVNYIETYYDNTSALMIDHGDYVVNYAEVTSSLRPGDKVKAGQIIAYVKGHSGGSMLHFELYDKGTTTNVQWYGSDSDKPKNLLDPTDFLQNLLNQAFPPSE